VGKYLARSAAYIGTAYALNDESRLIDRNFYGELIFNHSFNKKLDLLARFIMTIQMKIYWEIFPEGSGFQVA